MNGVIIKIFDLAVIFQFQVLKLYAWEGAFQDRLKIVRDKELSLIKRAAFYLAGTSISFSSAPILVCVF